MRFASKNMCSVRQSPMPSAPNLMAARASAGVSALARTLSLRTASAHFISVPNSPVSSGSRIATLRTSTCPVVIARGRRQLQYDGALTGDWPRDLHGLAAREFERVVVDVRIVHVDLPESGNLEIHARSAERAESALVLDVRVKSQFRARK
jgi:hypothetical protein